MGAGSLLYVHFPQVKQVGPDQPEIHHSQCLKQLIQSALDRPVHAVLGGELARLSS